jgi:cysteine-rich repeat protein
MLGAMLRRLASLPLSVAVCALVSVTGPACTPDDDGGDELSEGTDGTGDGDGDGDGGDGDGEDDDSNPDCGNGILDEGEVCDDGNRVTEYPPYAAGDCIDDCSLVLATCNDGMLDPGEDCDDGNADNFDGCTTSCTANHQAVHAACTVFENGEEVDPLFNISLGDIQNCDAITPVPGTAVGCNRSWTYIGNNKVYAAGGDCQMLALKCEGGMVCPPGPIGDYDGDISCPAGHVLVDKTIAGDGAIVPTIKSKVCLRACESDRDCRWNEADSYWGGPGEYRCQVTPLSGGAKVCNDGRNNDL